jgi:hypothetical protein
MSSPNNAYKTHRDLSTTGATAETGILSCAVGMHRGGGVQLTGTFTATVQFEETLDSGTTWIAKTVYPAGGGAGVTSASATGQWKFATGGSTNFRVRCSAFTSGPIVVDLTLTEGVDPFSERGANGGAFSSTVTLTRTNDTNIYGANDVIGAATGSTAALSFATIGPSGGGPVLLTTARMAINLSAVISGMGNFRLYFYNVTPPSALGDNAAWDLPAGDRTAFLGFVDLGTPVDLGSTLYVETVHLDKQVVVPAGGILYAYLVTQGAYTPSASDVFRITLNSIGL